MIPLASPMLLFSGGTPTPTPTPFGQDAFAGSLATALTTHTPDIGGSWIEHASYGSGVFSLDGAGGVNNNGQPTLAYINNSPASADYYVQTDLVFYSNLSNDYMGVVGRVNTGADTFYSARWLGGNWYLHKDIGSGLTTLAAPSDTFSSGTKRLRLTMIGSTISMSVNGTVIASVTDTDISAAGKAGIISMHYATQSATTGIHQSAFIALN